MKRIIIFQFLFIISTNLFSQGADTIVTNLNIRASTIYSFAYRAKASENPRHFAEYLKWYNTIRATTPADNANVNIDTVHSVLLADIYQYLIETPGLRPQFEDFQTSVQSKRASNTYLDGLLDAIDALFLAQSTAIIAAGYKLIFGVTKP